MLEIDYNIASQIAAAGVLTTVGTVKYLVDDNDWARFYWILAFIAAANI